MTPVVDKIKLWRPDVVDIITAVSLPQTKWNRQGYHYVHFEQHTGPHNGIYLFRKAPCSWSLYRVKGMSMVVVRVLAANSDQFRPTGDLVFGVQSRDLPKILGNVNLLVSRFKISRSQFTLRLWLVGGSWLGSSHLY